MSNPCMLSLNPPSPAQALAGYIRPQKSYIDVARRICFVDIKKAIQARDALIRKDLIEFIGGQKHRVD